MVAVVGCAADGRAERCEEERESGVLGGHASVVAVGNARGSWGPKKNAWITMDPF
jgi:hypothetical protein